MFSRPLLVLAIFLLAIVLFVFLRFTPSDYLSLFFHFVLFILLIVLSAIDLHFLITYHFFFILSFLFYSLYCPPSIYTFWLPITFFHFVLFILLIVLSAIDLHLLITTVVPSNFFFYSMYCASFDLRLLITPLVPSTFSVPLLLLIVLCFLRSTASDYTFGTCDLFCPSSFTHCIVRPSIYGFWLPLWYLRPFLSLFFYSLYCASFDLRLLITPLVPSTFSVPLLLLIVLCVLRFTASD